MDSLVFNQSTKIYFSARSSTQCFECFDLEYFDKRKRRRKHPGLSGKAKYTLRSIVNKYREGKVKSSPARAVK